MIADIALCVTAAGVIAAVFGLRQSYRERLRQFEAMYVQRYWSIIDRLSLGALASATAAHPDDGDEKAIRAYLLLCEDELEMRARGYIADGTYWIWADGIRGQLRQPMFEGVWKEVGGCHLAPALDPGPGRRQRRLGRASTAALGIRIRLRKLPCASPSPRSRPWWLADRAGS
jgi:hypothetical protein